MHPGFFPCNSVTVIYPFPGRGIDQFHEFLKTIPGGFFLHSLNRLKEFLINGPNPASG